MERKKCNLEIENSFFLITLLSSLIIIFPFYLLSYCWPYSISIVLSCLFFMVAWPPILTSLHNFFPLSLSLFPRNHCRHHNQQQIFIEHLLCVGYHTRYKNRSIIFPVGNSLWSSLALTKVTCQVVMDQTDAPKRNKNGQLLCCIVGVQAEPWEKGKTSDEMNREYWSICKCLATWPNTGHFNVTLSSTTVLRLHS